MGEEIENVPECECCGAGAIDLTTYNLRHPQWKPIEGNFEKVETIMCDLCANTHVSLYKEYPSRELSNNEIGKVICFVGNEILKAINKRSR